MQYLLGQLIGRPVIALFEWVFEKIRHSAYADVEGRYYQFGTNPIDIIEGPDAERWLAVNDVRRTITRLPGIETLRRIYPTAVRSAPEYDEDRIEARTLAAVLCRAKDDKTIKFLRWLRRTVILPADNRAARESS